ncbi:MAG: MarR family transcriptional regulator [Desulfovibrio sp.]|jgi:DNA-binding MarR family transcriptional regulator|nr:MarR family transcriptional regulator [Desulfovibrio sp.]
MNENNATPDTTVHNETLTVLFHHAVKIMVRIYHHQGHAEHAQTHILAILKAHGSINQRELLEMLNVRSTSLSELLDKLEHRGFITRARDERDKRNFIITATEQGKATTEGHEDARQKNADALFASLSDEDRQKLGELLGKLVNAWRKKFSGHDSKHECGHNHHRPWHEHECGHEHHISAFRP